MVLPKDLKEKKEPGSLEEGPSKASEEEPWLVGTETPGTQRKRFMELGLSPEVGGAAWLVQHVEEKKLSLSLDYVHYHDSGISKYLY